MHRLRLLLVSLIVTLGACGPSSTPVTDATTVTVAASSGGDMTTSLPAGSIASSSSTAANPSSTSPTPPTSTAAIGPLQPVCSGWLEFVGTGDPAVLHNVLDDPALLADLDIAMATDADFQSILDASARLEEGVVEICREDFMRGIVAARSDSDALEELFNALSAGDRDRAAMVAMAHVMAQIDSVASTMDLAGATFTVDGDVGLFQFPADAGGAMECLATGGVVVKCTFVQ